MSAERSSIFEADDLDLSAFKPAAKPRLKDEAAREDLRQTAERKGFASREPVRSETVAAAPRPQRRHTTGRNRQLNIKASAETIERFYALADRHGWVLGETFEHAVAALEDHARAADKTNRQRRR